MIEVSFAIALLLLGYTYLGYPALVWLLARVAPSAVALGALQPFIAIVIVVRNEEGRIHDKLASCLALDYPKDKLRVVVVSDGSTDGTEDIVRRYADRNVALLAFSVRRGKAACLNDALASCAEDIVVLTDARQKLDPGAARFLLANLADPRVGAVSGELVFETEDITAFGEGVDFYWRYEKFIRQQESRIHSTVGVTGALYALRTRDFRRIPDDTILDDVLIPMNVVLAGRRVVFDSRAKAFDFPSRDARAEKARKVRTIAGNYQLIASHPRFLVPWRNPVFLQLVSHKVLRLGSPLFLAVMLVTSAVLASHEPAFRCLLGAQLLGYVLPAIGFLVPVARQWKVVRVASAFLLLNWFAVLGAIEFLRDRNTHLWDSGRPSGGLS